MCTPPPLSPTKSISSCDWSSPPTPVSPRKTRSCLLLRTVDYRSLTLTSPVSPIKSEFHPNLGPSPSGNAHRTASIANWPSLSDASLVDNGLINANNEPFQTSSHITHSNSHSVPRLTTFCEYGFQNMLANSRTPQSVTPHMSTSSRRFSHYLSSNGIESDEDIECHEDNILHTSEGRSIIQPPSLSPNTSDNDVRLNQLTRLPLRCSSCPLRPSQLGTRGGLLSTTRRLALTPDRFISSRRPPHMTRENFELSNPSNRPVDGCITTPWKNIRIDPFSRHLHRSGRMDDELRSIRETYSILASQTQMNRRGVNMSIRRSSFTLSSRQVSAGAVWNVGGMSAASDTVTGVFNGRGGLLGRGTNAPLYTSMFLNKSDPDAETEAYERRLALAFDLSQGERVLDHCTSPAPQTLPDCSTSASMSQYNSHRHVWKDSAWAKEVLDAPQLRDDYYCSLLAYSHTAKCLAVGLGNFVHLWSEKKGVDTPELLNMAEPSDVVHHITSLDFSSTQGAQAILAVGRADGRLSLWSPFDTDVRFSAKQPNPISCVAFRPNIVKRPSRRDPAINVTTEELLVGDEIGHIYFYSIEWPGEVESALFGWNGSLSLVTRLNFHSQQICGLSWSVDGELFASGGNDNACYLLETKTILHNYSISALHHSSPDGETVWTLPSPVSMMDSDLNAAVKAIAFCPWQRGLIAVGGGSNDRCIHFFHTISGACLATIDCAAQITSLVWSRSRKEIAATFGFAQPEHPYRVAVFAWPSCEQVVAIPWYDENRALYAIPYPGSSNSGRESGDHGIWRNRATEEGCIVVAASDAAIRFHEIWSEDRRSLGNGVGLLGGTCQTLTRVMTRVTVVTLTPAASDILSCVVPKIRT
ncbi:meiosis-specific APC/C activator protein AMA1 [Dendryphion nanum]|uniref:Meiosis-specific APC/C activator protein AMA1 n=1 Tax=Dendryphion nanum TaxID=256645 RepID=A0A9P9DNN6_9PLEO|nr:meiosis-specific APC/C activator protein AMA1 [Dendryphion nanum]